MMQAMRPPLHAKDLRPPGDTDIDYVETCAVHVANHMEKTAVVVMLRPWSNHQKKSMNILAPTPEEEGGTLDQKALEAAAAFEKLILVPCTLSDPGEEVGARRIIASLLTLSHACVISLQLLPLGFTLGLDNIDFVMARHDGILGYGVDDIMINPDIEPTKLRRTIKIMQTNWEYNLQRQELIWQAEAPPVSMDTLNSLEHRHQKLLWESVPKALLPNLPPVDTSLTETTAEVGKFRMLSRDVTRSNDKPIIRALSHKHESYVLKVFEKARVMMPVQLEAICREFSYLKHKLSHPHIIKCHKLMHSKTRLYMVLDNAGPMNLMNILSTRPGRRLEETAALACWSQLASALEYCHSLDIAHRQVCPEHVVVVVDKAGGGHICRLVDFSAAVTQKTGKYCGVTGTLPFVAPETVLAPHYLPMKADCWCAGAVLLETAGGLQSIESSVGFESTTDQLQNAANLCMQYFGRPHAHATALGFMQSVQSMKIVEILKQLMCPRPTERAPISDALRFVA